MLKLIRNFNRNIHENIRENRRVFLLYTVLRVLVIVALVRAIMNGNYNGAFICLLSLGLFLVPSLLEQGFKIHIPPLLEGTIYSSSFLQKSSASSTISTPPSRNGTPSSTP